MCFHTANAWEEGPNTIRLFLCAFKNFRRACLCCVGVRMGPPSRPPCLPSRPAPRPRPCPSPSALSLQLLLPACPVPLPTAAWTP